jgi:hypothetical protein
LGSHRIHRKSLREIMAGLGWKGKEKGGRERGIGVHSTPYRLSPHPELLSAFIYGPIFSASFSVLCG